jgi:predicted transposase/invertase (TIGR01784 family)
MRRDTIFYKLFQQSPTLLFELLPQPPERAAQYIFEAVEVKETAFRMDGVFLPPDSTGIVYFAEVQFQKDELLYERIDSEIGIYIYRNRDRFSDWRAVVIYPTRSIEQSNTVVVREFLDSGRILRVYLDELGEIAELPIGIGLMVLTTIENEAATLAARGLIERSGGERAIIDLISTIIVYKFDNLTREEVDVMLGIELQRTRVYQEAKAEGESIGEARGEARGEIRMLTRLINRKFGDASARFTVGGASTLENRIGQLNVSQLEELGEALLDFTSVADLEAWLDRD